MDRYRTIMKEIQVREQLPKFKDIFIRVHRLLGNTYPFYSAFNDIYCKYVNFVLNKIISPLYNEEEKLEYFSLFDKFGKILKEKQGSVSTCLPNLQNIKPVTFTKMNSLYDLYDRYNDLVEAKKSKAVFLCNDLTMLRVHYNIFLSTYDGKENKLIEKLIKLKELIRQNIFSTNTLLCDEGVTHFREPEKYLEKKRQLEILEQEKERAQQQLQQQQDKNIESSGYKHTRDEEETDSSEPDLSSQPQEEQWNPMETEQPHVNTVVPEFPKYSGKSMVARNPHKQGMEENEVEKYGTVYPTSAKNEELGYLGKVQGFFTETLGQVEPAPILGVSGGMGALFLLFKYTPVGSFFGRRRGLNHRIPGGFPGAYPGFPEYYDGNFGNMPINISYQAE